MRFSEDILIAIAQLKNHLLQQSGYLVTAESCTGGGLAYAMTELPGSSAWFEYGFVTYSNLAKHSVLRVPNDILMQFGAVSAPVVKAMVLGALQYGQATHAIAVSGIAGPSGGTVDKPVGTVWFGFAKQNDLAITQCTQFSGDRQAVRQGAIRYALKESLRLWTN